MMCLVGEAFMSDDFGKLIVRLAVGPMLLLHGMHKLLNGIGMIKQMVASHGLPDMLAYGAYVGEIAGPMLVILGVLSRLGGSLIVIDMLAAMYLAGSGRYFALNAQGGYALELEMFYLLCGLAVAFLGAGRFSVGGARGQFN